MRSNRSKSPLQPPDTNPRDIPADRWQPNRGRSRKTSALLPTAIVVLGLGIVAAAAYATAVLFNLHPDHVIANLWRKPAAGTTTSASQAGTPSAPNGTAQTTNLTSETVLRAASRFPRPFALWRTITYSLTDATPDQPQPFQGVRQMSGDLQYVDGSTFQTENTLIKLSGISSLPREAVCIGDNKAKFACGLMARASLSLLVTPERPRCYPDVSLAVADPTWLCTSRGRLLSAAQIEAGFALPSQPSIETYVDLAAKAHAARVGAWNGDWTVVTPANGGQ